MFEIKTLSNIYLRYIFEITNEIYISVFSNLEFAKVQTDVEKKSSCVTLAIPIDICANLRTTFSS